MRQIQSLIALCALSLLFAVHVAPLSAQQPREESTSLGVVTNKPGAFQGYTLVFPLRSTHTDLVDMAGRVVNTWKSRYGAGQEAYLLENGNLLRAAGSTSVFRAYRYGTEHPGLADKKLTPGKLLTELVTEQTPPSQ